MYSKSKELAKNTIIITVGKICTQFISFLLLPIYTSYLTTEQYGVVDLVTTYVQLLFPILFFQIDQAIFRFLIDQRKNQEKKEVLISSTFAFYIFQTISISILFLISLFWFRNEYRWFLYLNLLGTGLSAIMLQFSRGLGDNLTYSIASFIAGVSAIILNIIFIVPLAMGAEGMMIATFISHILCSAFIAYRLKIHQYLHAFRISRVQIKELLKYAFPLIPNAISWWLVNASDRTIVLFFLGTSANGILAASHKFSTVFTTAYSVFNMSWTESITLHFGEEDRDSFFSSTFDTVYRLFAAGCIGIIAFMPFVFSFFIKEQFAEAYYQIPIYMIAGLFSVIVGLYSVIYIAVKKTSEIAKTSILAGVINIIVNLLLIRHIGLYAASISSAVSYAAMAVYRAIDSRRYVNHKINYYILISSFVLLCITFYGYYCGDKLTKISIAILAVAYAIIINYQFTRRVINVLLVRIKNMRNK